MHFILDWVPMGLTPFAKPDARSNVVIAVNYLPGIDDKKFRDFYQMNSKYW